MTKAVDDPDLAINILNHVNPNFSFVKCFIDLGIL